MAEAAATSTISAPSGLGESHNHQAIPMATASAWAQRTGEGMARPRRRPHTTAAEKISINSATAMRPVRSPCGVGAYCRLSAWVSPMKAKRVAIRFSS